MSLLIYCSTRTPDENSNKIEYLYIIQKMVSSIRGKMCENERKIPHHPFFHLKPLRLWPSLEVIKTEEVYVILPSTFADNISHNPPN
jgi:hypothetical protein